MSMGRVASQSSIVLMHTSLRPYLYSIAYSSFFHAEENAVTSIESFRLYTVQILMSTLWCVVNEAAKGLPISLAGAAQLWATVQLW